MRNQNVITFESSHVIRYIIVIDLRNDHKPDWIWSPNMWANYESWLWLYLYVIFFLGIIIHIVFTVILIMNNADRVQLDNTRDQKWHKCRCILMLST